MFISDKFLELLKETPNELLRETHTQRTYYDEHKFYLIKMTWVVGPSTIYIEFKDSGSFEEKGTKSISLMKVKLSKKKYYGLYTARTELNRNDMSVDVRAKVVEAFASHYFDTTDDEWKNIVVGPTVDDYL